MSYLKLHLKALLVSTTVALVVIFSLAFNNVNSKINSINSRDVRQLSASSLVNYKALAVADSVITNGNL